MESLPPPLVSATPPPPSFGVSAAHKPVATLAWNPLAIAQRMVTLITEKLQNQSLEDSLKKASFIYKNEAPHSESLVSSCKLSGNTAKDSKSKPLHVDIIEPWDQVSSKTGTHISLETPPYCKHSSSVTQPCFLCDTSLATPPAPPKKRHCRSLSIPGDRTGGKEQLWKPVALRPGHNNNNKLMKNRNSPVSHSHKGGSTVSLPGPSSSFNCLPYGGGLWSRPPSDYFSTPPESPVPRPASASSGYYDSSLSSLNAPWLEHSPIRNGKVEAFKLRSLSMEDTISQRVRSNSGGSMPAVNGMIGSTPSSPRRQRIPRCRSQPCVLHDRKCGIKRRREEDRPALDFHKMKETAIYPRYNKAMPILHPKSSRSLANEFASLHTIASSPLDSSLPPTAVHVTTTSREDSDEEDDVLKDCDKRAKFDVDLAEDSGCSVNNDPTPDIGEDSDSCSCHENETVFHIDVSNEIDLDQMEKD